LANHMEKIDPSDLLGNGYTEESGWERDFGKAYCWPNLFLLVALFAGLIAVLRGSPRVELVGYLVFLVSFISVIVLWCFMRHSKPASPITGKKLSQYLNAKPTPRDASSLTGKPIVEVVYVDHDSKKFYKVVFLENDPIGSVD